VFALVYRSARIGFANEARGHQDLPCSYRFGELGTCVHGIRCSCDLAPFWGTTGQITRADASPDWTHGSIAGSVSGLPPTTHHTSFAVAYVVPNGAVCYANEFPNPNPGVPKLVWESPRGNQNPSFDIPEVPLDSGTSPRICLYGVYEYLFALPGAASNYTFLASRFFTVPPPPPSPQGKRSEVTLSRGTALSKAKSALKKRFGKAYKRSKRKRLRCSKRSSARYLCTFSFRYRKKRQDGTVTVAIKPNGSVTTKIKRR
jgi:hypothetical protein